MRVQLRIVAGALRGRKINCNVSPELRPTPQMVREALFSILGNAVPDRPFVDVFAGTGVNGLEALSRGASGALFVERDFRLSQDIGRYLSEFRVADRGHVIRTDAYRWAALWHAPAEPVNVFVSPPFADLDERVDDFLVLMRRLQEKITSGSVLIIQSEKHKLLDSLPDLDQWEQRRYGRNMLLLWVKPQPPTTSEEPHDRT